MLASAESLLGSIWFAFMLGLIGAVAGFIYCRKGKAKE
jgi:hypothetical protein